MAEYIDRNKVLLYEERVIINHYDGNETLYVVSTEEIRGLTPADVVERENINKAIKEIEQEIQNGTIKILNGNEKLFNILKGI